MIPNACRRCGRPLARAIISNTPPDPDFCSSCHGDHRPPRPLWPHCSSWFAVAAVALGLALLSASPASAQTIVKCPQKPAYATAACVVGPPIADWLLGNGTRDRRLDELERQQRDMAARLRTLEEQRHSPAVASTHGRAGPSPFDPGLLGTPARANVFAFPHQR